MARAAPKVAVGVGAVEGDPRPEGEGVLDALPVGVGRFVRDTVGVARAGATLALPLAAPEGVPPSAVGVRAPLAVGSGGRVALPHAVPDACEEGEGEPRGERDALGERLARADAVPAGARDW
jgi:hypothetical protein